MVTGFALRAPWYVRERGGFGLRDARALRPAIQMYDATDFVERLLDDPRDSVRFTQDDLWSYPIPVTPSPTSHGRARLATSRLVTTQLRKLYQPNHDRFYAVVVEVLCDEPGLPRAGSHEDLHVGFVVRRQITSVAGARGPSRRLARDLLVELAGDQHLGYTGEDPAEDVRDLWWADRAWRDRFREDHQELIDRLEVQTREQGWFTADRTARWLALDESGGQDVEETFPMWRLPPREQDCAAARTRSLWFGIVPTWSDQHWTVKGAQYAKLDDQSIYQIECFVRQDPPPGREHCPQPTYWSAPTEPFRLASPVDPQGTSKRTTTIVLPDLRRLAARAGQPQGPGGVRVVTPPNSRLMFNPFAGIPKSGTGRVGTAGSVCTFALELFFIVAFFLFLMFLPIVVLAFQLWWMLALRFCFPPSIAFAALADFFASGKLLAALDADAKIDFDAQFGIGSPKNSGDVELPGAGTGGWADELNAATDPGGAPIFTNDANLVEALVTSTDPTQSVPPAPLPVEPKPDDPLCP